MPAVPPLAEVTMLVQSRAMRIESRGLGRFAPVLRAIALGFAVATSSCAASETRGADQPFLRSLVAVDESAVEPAGISGVELTEANEFDGELRIAEPGSRASRRAVEEVPQTWVMPLYERQHPRIASQAKGSVSIGTVTAGFLASAAELPVESTEVRVLDKVVARNTRFTTAEMRDLLMCAAKAVAKAHPGRVLQLGNLSRMGGGPLPWSVSHHNGRDADLAFYALDDQGNPAKSDRLYHFDRRLKSTDSETPLAFDVAANWTFVKALLSCEGPQIQYLFIANWLKQPMLQHAVKSKEDKEIIARAAAILHQPKKALAHNDHLHLRIACSPSDQSEGCVNASRAPAVALGRQPGVQARLPGIRAALQAADAQLRAGAVQLLGLYRDEVSIPQLLSALHDAVPTVRIEAAKALAAWNPAGADRYLAEMLAQETVPDAAVAQLAALAEMGAVHRLADALADRRVLVPPTSSVAVPLVNIRKLAVNLLGYSGSLLGARAAIQLLDDDHAEVRDEARNALERLTNYATVDLIADLASQLPQRSWVEPLDPTGEKVLWLAFLDSLPADATRQEVALRGLARHGVEIAALDRHGLPGLVQALALPGPWRDNAARWIAQVVAHRPKVGSGAAVKPTQYWTSWLVQRRLVSAAEAALGLASAAGIAAAPPAAPQAADSAPATSGAGGTSAGNSAAAAHDDD